MAGSHSSKLTRYARKRDFSHTPEPAPASARHRPRAADARRFVVHLHHARRRHFDLRLEVGGVLRSWAVPKGPSLDPAQRRLAVQVEDHPLSYGNFEGTIPAGNYGAGSVAIWDRGTWTTDGSAARQLGEGHLRFEFHGTRLHGHFSLVRMHAKPTEWLLFKAADAFAVAGNVADDVPLADVVAEPDDATTTPARNARRKKSAQGIPPATQFEFQLARLQAHAAEGDDWLHEVKYDGYRAMAWRSGAVVRVFSRNRIDWTPQLPSLVAAVRALACRECALDGELVVFDGNGRSRFDLLQKAFGDPHAHDIRYAVFDLLALDGEDLREWPLHARKAVLQKLLANADGTLVFSNALQGHGPLAFQQACAAGLEGIVSKRADAPYVAGRNDTWRKSKCTDSDEFLIVGYTPGKGSRGAVGALLLAEPQDGAWRYVGRVGTGMDTAMLQKIEALLRPARHPPALVDAPDRSQLHGAQPVWVAHRHVAEIEYRGRTGDGLLRQASFKGLRPDKSPTDLQPSDGTKDTPMNAQLAMNVADDPHAHDFDRRLTHPDRVIIEQPRVTKRDLANFYADIAAHLLPDLAGRPLALLRCPEGAEEACFFQKHPIPGMTDAVRVGETRGTDGKPQTYMYVEDTAGVLALVQMGTIEFHTWGSTTEDIEHPDHLVFDLDPDPDVEWSRVREGARQVRARLRAVGLTGFLRTTGGKGLHVVVPLYPRPDWEQAKAFAHALARTLEQEAPNDFVSVASRERRKGRIFVDYLRNGRGATSIASYCVRARPGAGIATPIGWDELARVQSAAQYNINNIGRRIAALRRNPWRGYDKLRQTLPA
ncbi:MAG TPA: DNA ligase D [Rhodanobacteraceae bacterium]